MKPDFVFSRNECAAYIVAIVRAFERQHKGKYLGRTALQKLAYFSKELGTPIPCSFEIYTYGPYSDTITFTVDSLQADDVLVDLSKDSKYSNYKLGPLADEFLQEWSPSIKNYLPIVENVVEGLGGFSPQELELIATLHFIARRQRTIHKAKPPKEGVIAEFREIKHNKFPLETIRGWYESLENAHLI